MKPIYAIALAVLAAIAIAALGAATSSSSSAAGSYVVVYKHGVSNATARQAVKAAGGQVVKENTRVGVATAVSKNPNFLARVRKQDALFGAMRNSPVGRATAGPNDAEIAAIRAAARGTTHDTSRHESERIEPLAGMQWDMRMIRATPDGSYARERGDKHVLAAVIDTGIDGNHPDIKDNFNRKLSRNFTTDVPFDPLDPTEPIDGPCEDEPDNSCSDPADVDENSHGTHVASTIGSPINKLGVAGVAPNVTLVNLRAGQDSGFFFLQPTVDAFTFAGDHGIDVANMSFFTDPWLYNCTNHPSDSPAARMQQRTVIEATQRAIDYAHARGVTFIAASGNDHQDLGAATKTDTQSPNFPLGTNYTRIVDNTCLDVPTESNHVLSVNSIGPSERKADYSNYGVEQSTVAAPGGFFRDDPLWKASDPPAVRGLAGIPNLILAAYPENVAREFGEINPDGTPNTPFVVRSCRKETCAYYQWIQGTSMASPHAAGVAALIVSAHGKKGGKAGMDPDAVQEVLQDSARDKACPEPRLHSYADKLRPASFNAFCDGTPAFNGFYGHGIVDALAAVGKRKKH